MILTDQYGNRVYFFLRPRQKADFIAFLIKRGFKPEVDKRLDNVRVSKRIRYESLVPQWHRHTGYDKILKRLLARYKS